MSHPDHPDSSDSSEQPAAPCVCPSIQPLADVADIADQSLDDLADQPTGILARMDDQAPVSVLAAQRMQGNLISMISHELRTPLNTISGFLEIVLDGQVGPLNERQQEFLGYVRTGAQQLTTLVEDILFISKADAGQFLLRLGPVEIPVLVESVLTALHGAAERAGVRLEADVAPGLPTIEADGLRVQQVLSNLVNNAIKFTNRGGVARITVRQDGDAILFQVSDTGRGIASRDLKRIFERFYQSDNAGEAQTGGHGLGLAIARLIVEQHHGHIWVESALRRGSTFSFTIPVAPLVQPQQEVD